MADQWETTDVLVCGCGPTGAMLSAFLGRANVANVVLEKEPGITTDPRGIALDDDGIRLLQGLGLYDAVFSDIGSFLPGANFVGGVHHDFHKRPLMQLDAASTAGNTGHIGVLRHKQPVLEKHLRRAISASPSSSLRHGCTVNSISEDTEWVYVKYVDAEGQQKQIRAHFLIGADGKTGFVRKNYLEPKGIQMQWAEATKYQESWVALNWKMTLPTPKTHPTFPLWSKGYTPEQVYDEFFPDNFRFMCNPSRPAVCGRFGLQSDRLWRFEFVVATGEDDDEMAKPEAIRRVVFPYLTHPGSRYGLSESITFPEDCIQVLRCRPFRFSARSCNRWSEGRVVLCGDAAHVFPPFGGQGIASGFRDAVSLSWRLALACQSKAVNHRDLLTGWYLERKQQLESSLASTVRNGDLVNSKNPFKIFLRDWGLWLVQFIPSVKRYLELGHRADVPMTYKYEDGMSFAPQLGGGINFAQTYCVSLTDSDNQSASNGQVRFTDDVIFAPEKTKLFQIVVLLSNADEAASARDDLDGLDETCRLLAPDEATFFVPRASVSANPNEDSKSSKAKASGVKVFRTASGDEFAKSELCEGRPEPRGYREDDMWTAAKGKRYVIIRSDRFIFAACDGRLELDAAARRLAELFPSS